MDKILKLGNPLLYQVSKPVLQSEIPHLKPQVDLLQDLILEVRKIHGFGRGIAAPQIGLMKRLFCLNIDGQKTTLYNPKLTHLSDEMFELWDDCMCFPNLLVKVNRHVHCKVSFKDENWQDHTWELTEDLSELVQHEYDHLDGILATQRAIDDRSFRVK